MSAMTHTAEDRALYGFWVFMMSDLILFGLMFATYGTMLTTWGFASGPEPSELFSMGPVAIETAILLVSSLTFGLATLALKHGQGRGVIALWLVITLALGLGFLAMELRDFAEMAAEGAVPQRSGWLSAFFGLVSLHGLHVAAGCVWIMVMLAQLAVFGPTLDVASRLSRLGLFWHFLDVIWIGIFSVVYLGALA